MFAPFHSRTQSCPCFIFGLRNKARGCAEYGFSSLLSGAWYTSYIAFIKFCFVASTVLLSLRANNERFENNLIDRLPRPSILPTFDLFLEDARGDNPPSTSLLSGYSRHLSSLGELFSSPSHDWCKAGTWTLPVRPSLCASPSSALGQLLERSRRGWRNFRRVSIRTWPIWHLEGTPPDFPG